MVVPLVRNVQVEVELKDCRILDTWAPKYQVSSFGKRIKYTFPAIHSGDYETIVLLLDIPKQKKEGERRLVTVRTSYQDLEGNNHQLEPLDLAFEFVEMRDPVYGFSDARVLRAGSMLRLALALKDIAVDYYLRGELGRAFFRANAMKMELINAGQKLDTRDFEHEISFLEEYLRILGEKLGLSKRTVEVIVADAELPPGERDRPFENHLDNLFRELALILADKPPGNIAVSGFSFPDGRKAELLQYLNEAGEAQLATIAGSDYRIVERRKLGLVLEEQEMILSDLVETDQAVRIGRILAADYILTGTVFEMSASLAVFGRIINVQTAAIEAVAQVIVPLDEELQSLF